MTATGPAVTQVSSIKSEQPIVTDYTLQKEHTIDSTHKEPRDALDAISGPSVGSQMKDAASKSGTAIASAATTAGHVISEKAQAAGHAISEKAHEVDARYHLGDKMRDAASFAGAALKQGNPIHAVKHVSSAAAIGSAERAKHENGPLPEGAHSVTNQLADSTNNMGASTVHGAYSSTPAQPTNMDIAKEKVSDAAASVSAAASTAGTKISNTASVAASNASASMSSAAHNASIMASDAANTASIKASELGSQMQHSMATSSTNVGNKATDAASFAGTALKQGNPVFAASNAGTAAMIGQAERDKHAIGNLTTESAIRANQQL